MIRDSHPTHANLAEGSKALKLTTPTTTRNTALCKQRQTDQLKSPLSCRSPDGASVRASSSYYLVIYRAIPWPCPQLAFTALKKISSPRIILTTKWLRPLPDLAHALLFDLRQPCLFRRLGLHSLHVFPRIPDRSASLQFRLIGLSFRGFGLRDARSGCCDGGVFAVENTMAAAAAAEEFVRAGAVGVCGCGACSVGLG